jgi:uncharacterized protein (DUF952 family)
VYKIVRPDERTAWQTAGDWSGSEHDRRDGFVHLSTGDQVGGTLARHFADAPIVHLIEVGLEALPDVRWELSRGGAAFPHVYGPLPWAAVRHERRLDQPENGWDPAFRP